MDEINEYLRENLSEYRFNHVMRVYDMALSLGEIYHVENNSATNRKIVLYTGGGIHYSIVTGECIG